MSTALVLAADGRREGGRWRRGSVAIGESPNSGTWQAALKECGVVLDYAPDLAPRVVDGTLTLRDAYQQADRVHRLQSADSPQNIRPAPSTARYSHRVAITVCAGQTQCPSIVTNHHMSGAQFTNYR